MRKPKRQTQTKLNRERILLEWTEIMDWLDVVQDCESARQTEARSAKVVVLTAELRNRYLIPCAKVRAGRKAVNSKTTKLMSEPMSELDDHVMTILKRTTIPLDVERICASLESENKGLASRSETRKAVRSFLQQWKPYITEQKMPNGSIGYTWKN